MPPKPFVISHLSDLHLTAREGAARSEPELFKPLSGMNAAFRELIASEEVRRSDLVLVTGDVTDRGDLDAWRGFWLAIASAGLDKSKLLVLPGNHDTCCLGLRLPLKKSLYRDKDLEKATKGLKLGRQPISFPWAKRVDPRIVIIGVNSNNLGNASATSNALGEIGYFQLEGLARLLYQHREVPVKILALHHSPNIPSREASKRRGTKPMSDLDRLAHQMPPDQRRALRLLCITHRVRLIAHGHLHVAEDQRLSGLRIVGAPASTEPVLSKGQTVYEYFQYTVKGESDRLYVKRMQHRPSIRARR